MAGSCENGFTPEEFFAPVSISDCSKLFGTEEGMKETRNGT